MSDRRVIDNQETTVAEVLRRELLQSESFDFVSAYFTIYGYELMEEALSQVEAVRFLFGDPGSVENLDPGDKDEKSFKLTDKGLAPNHALSQRQIAKRCEDWMKRDSVSVRSISRSDFLHGKMYLPRSNKSARFRHRREFEFHEERTWRK